MGEWNGQTAVKAQYQNADKLSTRISIHSLYSTNKTGFGNWIFSHYRLAEGARVLELGCGTGEMWRGREETIRKCAQFVLSDFSSGMLSKARETLSGVGGVAFEEIDIQDIPYPDDSFDAVIANMMLYHVPDIEKGLRQVRRVLRPGGAFYCATYGENGVTKYLCDLFRAYGVENRMNTCFTLQNGESILLRHFDTAEKLMYPDSLIVTNLDDMADYILSLTGMADFSSLPRETILHVLRRSAVNGALHIPKEYGLFIAR
ncbi:MAG: class I SAM-dependent methyltransferase [Clostridia bacterium]|nr:class I SAM-dependent methyltransferase [Clostridia bacterium]